MPSGLFLDKQTNRGDTDNGCVDLCIQLTNRCPGNSLVEEFFFSTDESRNCLDKFTGRIGSRELSLDNVSGDVMSFATIF